MFCGCLICVGLYFVWWNMALLSKITYLGDIGGMRLGWGWEIWGVLLGWGCFWGF